MEHRPRITDRILSEKLDAKGAVLISGPKWCGKTTTAEQKARSVIYMSQPDYQANNIEPAKIDPGLLLEGEPPILMDEWLIAPHNKNWGFHRNSAAVDLRCQIVSE